MLPNRTVYDFTAQIVFVAFDGIRAHHSSICGAIDGLDVRDPAGTKILVVGPGVKERSSNIFSSLLFLLHFVVTWPGTRAAVAVSAEQQTE